MQACQPRDAVGQARDPPTFQSQPRKTGEAPQPRPWRRPITPPSHHLEVSEGCQPRDAVWQTLNAGPIYDQPRERCQISQLGRQHHERSQMHLEGLKPAAAHRQAPEEFS